MTVQEPGPTILYTSWDVHKGIKKLFSDGSGRRVVLVAYVGVDALAFLPSPSGVRVVCSPQPIGTSHAAIGELLDRGAQVQFSDALHMKVFWSEKKGCIIGSANLSNHALGAGGLREAGVLLPASDVDIDRLLEEAAPREITEEDMDRLARQSQKMRGAGVPVPKSSHSRTYLGWYRKKFRQPWKLAWWEDGEADFSSQTIAVAKEQYGHEPEAFMTHAKSQIVPGDSLLSFCVSGERISRISWMWVDQTVKLSKDDRQYDSDYPYQAFQANRAGIYEKPFTIDTRFRKAFKNAIVEFGVTRILEERDLSPPVALLEGIAKHYAAKP